MSKDISKPHLRKRQIIVHKPEILSLVPRLCEKAGISTPIIVQEFLPSASARATSFFRWWSAMYITTAMLERDTNEIEAVVGHEIGHLKNYDSEKWLASVAASTTLSVAVGIVTKSTLGLRTTLVTSGITLLTGAIITQHNARTSELAADRFSAEITGKPEALIGYFRSSEEEKKKNDSNKPFLSSLICRIWSSTLGILFSSHPNTQARITLLEEYRHSGQAR